MYILKNTKNTFCQSALKLDYLKSIKKKFAMIPISKHDEFTV